ncbi:hypothetical protein K438DRAFT_1930767 [Mycena galopus ATCC 62051]|nr:hypothetical protein K438DRAFT_1930767 [Mycena galopus ATCC 62051]
MSRERDESKTVNYFNISGGQGGKGGPGGVTGGGGGTGEGPTVNFTSNNIVNQGPGLEEVLGKWLEFPPDTKDRQYALQKLHHKATVRWLLCDNSTVIEEIILTCQQSTVAYFYFDFKKERQHMDIMLQSIIWQLSGKSPLPYRALDELYKKLGNGTIRPQREDLQAVLEDLLSDLDQTYIIIDGLDECDKTDWKPLVEFLHSLHYPTKNALHLLFTSQPLQEFEKAFRDIPFIELGSAGSIGDIRSFVGSEVPRVGNWASDEKYAEHVTKQIVEKSNGMFHMATCLLIQLGHCNWKDDWEKALTNLPIDLFGMYSHFLAQAKNTIPTVFIQAIFQWLVFSARQVTPDELADAIAFRLADPEFDFSDPAKSIYYPDRCQGNSDSFKLLEGLIMIKHNGSIKSITLAHSCVKDYILSPKFQ